MADETVISLTPANAITIILIAVLGFTVLGMVVKIWQRNMGTGA